MVKLLRALTLIVVLSAAFLSAPLSPAAAAPKPHDAWMDCPNGCGYVHFTPYANEWDANSFYVSDNKAVVTRPWWSITDTTYRTTVLIASG